MLSVATSACSNSFHSPVGWGPVVLIVKWRLYLGIGFGSVVGNWGSVHPDCGRIVARSITIARGALVKIPRAIDLPFEIRPQHLGKASDLLPCHLAGNGLNIALVINLHPSWGLNLPALPLMALPRDNPHLRGLPWCLCSDYLPNHPALSSGRLGP